MWNIKALALTVQKLLAIKVKVSERMTEWQTGQKKYVPQSFISEA